MICFKKFYKNVEYPVDTNQVELKKKDAWHRAM